MQSRNTDYFANDTLGNKESTSRGIDPLFGIYFDKLYVHVERDGFRSDVMASVLTSIAIDGGFNSRSSQAKP